MSLTRRTVLKSMAAAAPVAALTTLPSSASTAAEPVAIGRLADRIEAGMAKYAIPGAGLGVWYRGREYVRGFGVTNVDTNEPVSPDTAFRIGSTSKTFTATAIMRLVEQGRISLERPVRAYLPDFAAADPSVARHVTVRQLLNHSAGWQGDYFEDTGDGDDALAKYVADLTKVPQLTPLGKVFSYNNAALGVAGRVLEAVYGKPYETAVRELLLDLLGLEHSRFFRSELDGLSVATAHNVVDGKAVADPSLDTMPRSLHAAGGLISSARDQLRYARLHLGHRDLPQVLSDRTRLAMQSHPGPGGTLFVELNGVGVSWMLRPTAQGPTVVQHGGDWNGQHSGFLFVPQRDFALTLLTNSEGGPTLLAELFADDWALRELAGLTNLPAVPRPPRRLTEYVGTYVAQQIGFDGKSEEIGLDVTADDGELVASVGGQPMFRFAFYRKDFVLTLNPDGTSSHTRADFIRGRNGQVEWLRFSGRLFRFHPTGARQAKAFSHRVL